ncbi:MAG TPA: hypothetical protein VGN64_09960, partial [Dyadobacter sp.]|nr:hypothetical protein [Dyadobacter sp.]
MKSKSFLYPLIVLSVLCNFISISYAKPLDGGKLVGKIVEASNNEGVSFATVALLASKDSSLAFGVVADLDGVFTIT